MKKSFLSLLFVACCLSSIAQTGHNWEISKNLNIFNTLYKTLDLYYVDTLDAKPLIEDAIGYMLSNLDEYTKYFPQNEKADLKQMIEGKYAGIGALIRYYKKKDRCIIGEPYEGLPAAEAGLKSGDLILSIDGKDTGVKGTKDLADYTSSVSSALRGEPGTSFQIVVQRLSEKEPLTFQITRRAIQLPAMPYYGMMANNVGYICLDQYLENCSREVRNAIVELKQKGATSLILDLRNNGGGLLSEATEILNLFLPRGQKLVETKGKMESVNVSYSTRVEPLDPKIPLVVLVNEGTASASEITAGALQDYDRALIVGERTYGKGLVQQPREMPFGGTLKLTTSKYYIPSGRCIQKRDYQHRNADGRARVIPDSLTRVFYTKAKREVRDGGGITPDVIVKEDSLPNLILYLSQSDELIDYVTLYLAAHPNIPAAEVYDFPEEHYADFKEYIKKSGFTYDRQSKKALDLLKRMAEFEGYSASTKEEFKALETKLTHNEESDLDYWKADIKKVINAEIMRRVYYKKGELRNLLNGDKMFTEACRILTHPAEYKKALK